MPRIELYSSLNQEQQYYAIWIVDLIDQFVAAGARFANA